jgi:hypothetical protein
VIVVFLEAATFLSAPEIVTSTGADAIPLETTYIFEGPLSKFDPIVKSNVEGTIGVIDVVENFEVVA